MARLKKSARQKMMKTVAKITAVRFLPQGGAPSFIC
jgi:hypothetical protein